MRIKTHCTISALVVIVALVAGITNAAELKVESKLPARIQTPREEPVVRPANAVIDFRPLPAHVTMRHHLVGGADGAVAGAANETVIYDNPLGTALMTLPTNGTLADDITVSSHMGCGLRRIKFYIRGVVNPSMERGPFTIQMKLYNNCPQANGKQLRTDDGELVRFSMDFLASEDDIIHEIEYVVPSSTVLPLPSSTFWLSIGASRPNVAVIGGGVPFDGTTGDVLDFPDQDCNANLGGFPAFPNAGFRLQVSGDADSCPRAYPGYRNTAPARGALAGGRGICLADDIKLQRNDCDMVGYEFQVSGTGVYLAMLRTASGGVPGGMIPGTSAIISINDLPSDHLVLTAMLDEPVRIPETVFFAMHANNNNAKWTRTCTDAAIGGSLGNVFGTSDDFFVGNGPCTSPATTFVTDNPEEVNCHGGFDVTILCKGDPPAGACCDMYQTDDGQCTATRCRGGANPGESCVDDLDCDSRDCSIPSGSCAGGDNDGDICWDDGDCPGGVCGEPQGRSQHCAGGEFAGLPCFDDQDCAGDPLCRSLPLMNCAFPPRRADFRPKWQEGSACMACVGGTFDGATCLTNDDCRNDGACENSACVGGDFPGILCQVDGDCRGSEGICTGSNPFAPINCGEAACCTPSETCQDLTEKQCFGLPPSYDPFKRQWQIGQFCGLSRQRCPRIPCLGREGECSIGRDKTCVGGPTEGAVCNFDEDCRASCIVPLVCLDAGPRSGFPCTEATVATDCRQDQFPDAICGQSFICFGADARTGDPCNVDSDCDPLNQFPAARCRGHCLGDRTTACLSSRECAGQNGTCDRLPTEAWRCSNESLTPNEPCQSHNDCPGGLCIFDRCAGGAHDDEPCSELRDCAEAICKGSPGCDDPFCCTSVCEIREECCTDHWSESCGNLALRPDVASDCDNPPDNDTCAPGSRAPGAELITLGEAKNAALSEAHESTSDPGVCCHSGFPRVCSGGPSEGSRDGEFCDEDLDCYVNTCEDACDTGLFSGAFCAGSPNICLSFHCQGGANNGVQCMDNAECDSGVCDIGMYCKGGGNHGSFCVDSSECDSGVCSFPECTGFCLTPSAEVPLDLTAPCEDDVPCNSRIRCDLKEPEPGAQGFRSVWFRFEVPPGDPVSVEVHTCDSDQPRAVDSMIQVYTARDPDVGVCEGLGECRDGTVCSVVANDCLDGSACVVENRETACSLSAQDCPLEAVCVIDVGAQCDDLVLLGCDDDGCTGRSIRELNSYLCLPDLEPDQSYFIMVTAKAHENYVDETIGATDGRYRLRVSQVGSCAAAPSENDSCRRPTVIDADGAYPIDLDSATFECPSPECALRSQNDVWYEFHAPFNGQASFETCGGSIENTPDTEMVIYGPDEFGNCVCPGADGSAPDELCCSSNVLDGFCNPGSQCTVDVTAGSCYLVRVGDLAGSGGTGDLTVATVADDCDEDGTPDHCEISCAPPGCAQHADCGSQIDCNENGLPDVCVQDDTSDCCPPLVPNPWIDPPNGVVDAGYDRHPVSGETMGISQVTVAVPSAAAGQDKCWQLCEPANENPNGMTITHDDVAGIVTLTLDRPITAGACTTITYISGDGTRPVLSMVSHPGNVNADGMTDVDDIMHLVNYLDSGASTEAPFAPYSCNIDRSSMCAAPDVVNLVDLLNHAILGDSPAWLNTGKPDCNLLSCDGP